MNAAHLHITVVHIPVILTPLALVLLAVGHLRQNSGIAVIALWISLLASAFVVPAFLLGEPTEEIVEHLAGISEHTIEEHEEAAEAALWFSTANAVFSVISLIAIARKTRAQRALLAMTFLITAISSALLAYTAHQGGKIRHPEAYNQ